MKFSIVALLAFALVALAPAAPAQIVNPQFIQQGAGAVPRSLLDKAREAVSVRDFGAKGDCVADDAAAIQAAIDSLTEGIVYFPKTANCYNISAQLNLKSKVSLVGDGYGSRIHRAFTRNSQNIIVGDAVTNLSLSNLRITGNVTASPNNANGRRAVLIMNRSTGIRLERLWIDQVDTGIKGGGGVENVTVSDCIIGPMLHDGIQPVGNALVSGLGSIYWKIIHNYIETQNTLLATAIYMTGPATGYLIDGNTLVGGKWGIQLSLSSPVAEGDSKQHRIVNNIIISPAKDGILAVDADNTTYDILDITVSGNKVMTPGESGMLFEGIKGLVISGNTILTPRQTGIGVIKSGAYAHHNNDVTVTGNVVRGGGNAANMLLAGIKLESTNYAAVVGNTVEGHANQGIYVTGGAPPDDSLDNLVSGNVLKGNGGYGLRTTGSKRTRAVGNVYARNTLGEIWDAPAAGEQTRNLQAPTTFISTSAPQSVVDSAVIGWAGSTTYKVTIPTSAWTAAAATQDINIGRLLAKARLIKCVMDVTQAFNGTGWATATLRLGKSAGGQEYILDFDAKTATARKGLLDADLGTSINRANAVQGGDVASWTADTNLLVRLTVTGRDISAITQGSVTIYLTAETLP